MIASGVEVQARSLTSIIGGLLTDELGCRLETIKKHMAASRNLSIICAAEGGTFHRIKDEVQASSEEEAVFSFFYLFLDELFKLGTVAAIDIRDYADLSLQSFEIAR